MKITVEWLRERIKALEERYWEQRRWYYADFISGAQAEHHDVMSEMYREDIELYKRKLERVLKRENTF